MTDTDTPLREDVKLLGRLLGDVLKTHGGETRFALVEEARLLSRELRRGGKDLQALAEKLTALSDEDALFVARAFAHFLALANIAEQHHRERRLATRKQLAESLEITLDKLVQKLGKSAVAQAMRTQMVELVLTAHPTEVARRTILQKHNRIAALLSERDRGVVAEYELLEAALRREIEALWLTDEIRRERPTPEDEARGGWVVIEQSLWHAVPKFLRALDKALVRHTGEPLQGVPIRFASWMGGDRDGNPNVTAKVSRRVMRLSRWLAADLYLRDVDELRGQLSLNVCSDELRQRVGETREPYRKLLSEVRERLRLTRSTAMTQLDGYRRSSELLEVLDLCDRSLRETGAVYEADGPLLDLRRRVQCFGLGLVRLDLRQESTRHTQTLNEITKGAYEAWSEEQRREWLLKELQNDRPLIGRRFKASEDVQEVLDTFAVAAEAGEESVGAYVISMARAASDVLAVALLLREFGASMRVVPLFETIADLQAAQSTLSALFDMPWYREFCGGQQEVMIGYSDSAKDRGRLTAAFTLYEAQEQIAALCEEKNIALTLFHGRGGSVGRGGGSTHLAIAAQPPGTVNGRLRVTEQGEMIQAKFALPGVAFRTLELYTEATLVATLDPPAPPKAHWRETMRKVSERAAGIYEQLVKKTPELIAYFREATPIDELGTLNIGSRPARRKALTGVDGLRAIPWVFAWTQTRLHLPVWLGIGEALSEADPDTLREMYQGWPFLHATLDLIGMVLAKSEPEIAKHYDDLLVAPERRPLGEALRKQLATATEAVLEATGQTDLLKKHRSLARAIEVRNPYIDPLNVLQAEFLRRARQGGKMSDALLISVNGIANGMRNTG